MTQYVVPAHYMNTKTMTFLDGGLAEQKEPIPDPVDFYVSGFMKNLVYDVATVPDVEEFRQRIINVADQIKTLQQDISTIKYLNKKNYLNFIYIVFFILAANAILFSSLLSHSIQKLLKYPRILYLIRVKIDLSLCLLMFKVAHPLLKKYIINSKMNDDVLLRHTCYLQVGNFI